ncbi:2-keto-4-pentenoate hydratase [Streptomyces sp. NPDC088789]|uniref:2-keto-4-pentenoate hydratase n=1 Tax=Streptomyces sp. NPDC088789 TaxID=3365899 RepID=UPI0037F581B5
MAGMSNPPIRDGMHALTPKSIHRDLASDLWIAARDLCAVQPISVRHPELTLEDAYAIQREIRAMELADGASIVGCKIGATSEAIQKMFSIDHPDSGFLTDRMMLGDGAHLDADQFIQPKVEGEIAFRMRADLAGSSVTARDVLDAASEVFPVLEVLDSRFKNWKIKLVDTVADNASAAMVVVGAPVPLDGIDLAAEQMVFEAGGKVQTALGSAVMGNPAESVACLVRMLSSHNVGINAGDIVLAGSWVAAVDLVPGSVVRASFGSLGSVSLVVDEEQVRAN